MHVTAQRTPPWINRMNGEFIPACCEIINVHSLPKGGAFDFQLMFREQLCLNDMPESESHVARCIDPARCVVSITGIR
jgi:hypothetical protein